MRESHFTGPEQNSKRVHLMTGASSGWCYRRLGRTTLQDFKMPPHPPQPRPSFPPVDLHCTDLRTGQLDGFFFPSLVASPQLSVRHTAHNTSSFMKITLQRRKKIIISGYIKHNSVPFDSSLEARWSLQRSRLSQSLIHERSWPSANFHAWRGNCLPSFSSTEASRTLTVRNVLFIVFHHTLATFEFNETVCLLTISQLDEYPAPASCWDIQKRHF